MDIFAKPAVADRPPDPAIRSRLIGTHRLTMEWLRGDVGRVTIAEAGPDVTITGEVRSAARSDYAKIDGRITDLTSARFAFDGTVVLQVAGLAGGQACLRSGTMQFIATQDRTRLRLHVPRAHCGTDTDYFEIHF